MHGYDAGFGADEEEGGLVGVLRPGIRTVLDEEDPDLGIANDDLDIAAAVDDDEDEQVGVLQCWHAVQRA